MDDRLTRRGFIKLAGAAGGGLVLAVYLDACTPTSTGPAATATVLASATPRPFEWAPSIYLRLDQTGALTVTAFRSEMGQGIRTALAMVVAEEMDVEWKNVRIEQAPADPRYGDQVTGGSVSMSSSFSRLRLAGATAREMLIAAAAQAWGVPPAECRAERGVVFHPDGQQRLAYGDLVEAASTLELPDAPPYKDKSQRTIIGQSLGHWDAPQIVTGEAVFGLDVRLPGMLFAVLARCPVIGGQLVRYDDAAAKVVPGVRHILRLGNKVAVVADHTWAAIQGRKALVLEWDEGRAASLNSDALRTDAVNRFPVPGTTSDLLDAIYEMPYEAHAPMEPMNATAYVHDGKCEVWAPTQNAQSVWRQASLLAGVPLDNVTVHVTLMGGGFGRRLGTDYADEAVLISKELGVPVQVVWTRADDLQQGYFHGMTVQYASAPQGRAARPKVSVRRPAAVPTGPWRSVENVPDAYAKECFIDEMAAALNRDPLDLHLELYSGAAAQVIRLAAEKAGWGEPLPEGWGRGLAYYATWGATHVAYVTEVSVDAAGQVHVHRVVAAVDCGLAVNPGNVRAQIEGGIAFGLTATLKAEATIRDGRIEQSNFDDYPLLRIDEMPQVEVYIVESDEPPSGMGEMGVPPIAPAVANAVFAATGKRIRHVPIRPEDLRD